MELQVTEASRFQGWDDIVSKLVRLGPLRVVEFLINAAFFHLEKNDGIFVGDEKGLYVYSNHPLAVHVLLRLIADGRDDGRRIRDGDFSAAEYDLLESVLSQLNGLVEERVATPARQLWEGRGFQARRGVILSKLLSVFIPKRRRFDGIVQSVGRTWLFFSKYLNSTDPRIAANVSRLDAKPYGTGFDSLGYHFLFYLSLYSRRGWIEDTPAYFQNTELGGLASGVTEMYFPDFSKVVKSWEEIKSYPAFGLESPFLMEPVLSMGNRLFTPDPGLLFSGVEERLVRKATLRSSVSGSELDERVSTLLGDILELYVKDLLRGCIERNSHEEFVDSFEYARGIETPDAFVRSESGSCLVFEVKSSRLKTPLLKACASADFYDWLQKLCGEKIGRRPLSQGFEFYKSWRKRDAELVAKLGGFPGFDKTIYVLVCPEDVPFFTNSLFFRNGKMPDGFDSFYRELGERILVVSTRDLEIAAATIEAQHGDNFQPTLYGLLDGYLQAAKRSDGVFWRSQAPKKKMVAGFGEYLLGEYRGISGKNLELLVRANRDAFHEAGKRGFGEDIPPPDDED